MKTKKRVLSLALALVMAFGSFAPAMAAEDKDAVGEVITKKVEDVQIDRLAGKTRVGTSILASREAYKDGAAKTVVLAGYGGDVDALTGTLVAARNKAPLLVTDKAELTAIVAKEIERLGAKKAIILGGEKTVEKAVADALEKLGLTVERHSGPDRFATAVEVAGKTAEHVFLALGRPAKADDALADALAIGPVSAMKDQPVLLTEKDTLPQVTAKALKDLGTKNVTIIGGANSVSEKVEKALKDDLKLTVDRVSGKARELTALEIAKKYFEKPENILVASGRKSADALVGGYLGNLKKAPILLANTDTITDETAAYIKDHILNVMILGGKASVTDKAHDAIEKALTTGKEAVKTFQLSNVKAENMRAFVGKAVVANLPKITVEGKNKLDQDIKLGKALVKVNGVELIKDKEYKVDTTNENEVTLEEDYVNALKVGEYRLTLTLEKEMLADVTLTIRDIKATRDIYSDDVVVSIGKGYTIKVDDFASNGAPNDIFDIEKEDVVVSLDGQKLIGANAQAYNVSGKKGQARIFIPAAYLNTLALGEHKVDVTVGKTKASLSFKLADIRELNGKNDSAELIGNPDSDEAKFALEVKHGLADDANKVVVKVDGKVQTSNRYTATINSPVDSNFSVTLEPDYVKTLAPGKHSVEIEYDGLKLKKAFDIFVDGTPESTKSSLTIKKADGKDLAKDEKLVAGETYQLEFLMKDAQGRALGNKKVDSVSLTGADLSLKAKMPSGSATKNGAITGNLKTDESGKLVVYFKIEEVQDPAGNAVVEVESGTEFAKVDKVNVVAAAPDKATSNVTATVSTKTFNLELKDTFGNEIKGLKDKKAVVIKYTNESDKEVILTVDSISEVDETNNPGEYTVTVSESLTQGQKFTVSVQGVELGEVKAQ